MAQKESVWSHVARKIGIKVGKELPDNEAAQAVVKYDEAQQRKENESQEWQQWLRSIENKSIEDSRTSDPAKLEADCKQLIKAWREFQSKNSQFAPISGPPEINMLGQSVESTMRDWEEKREQGFGRARDCFADFCNAALSYKDIFSVIPVNDKYISLFTGVISTIVKAYARHQDIAECFCSSLADISKDLSFSQQLRDVSRTPKMESLVIHLYLKYVSFFCYAMSWYQSKWKRAKAAFKTAYLAGIKKQVDEVKAAVKAIEREADVDAKRVGRETGKDVKEVLESNKRLETAVHELANQTRTLTAQPGGGERWLLQLSEEFLMNASHGTAVATVERAITDKQQGQVLALAEPIYLQVVATRKRPEPRVKELSSSSESANSSLLLTGQEQNPTCTPLANNLEGDQPPPPSTTPLIKHHWESLRHASRKLESYYTPAETGASVRASLPGGPQVPGPVVTRIRAWIASPKSQFLWIIGAPHVAPSASDSFLAASHVVAVARAKGFLHFAFFCQRTAVDSVDAEGTQKIRLSQMLALLYSLVRQLVLMVPPTFEESFDLTGALSSLDGGPESIETAFKLVGVLLEHAPKVLLCVIDGLQFLDDPITKPHVERLLGILRPHDSRVVKVLLTTGGFISSGSSIGMDERLNCVALPGKKPGKALPGGRSLVGVMFPRNGSE